MYKNKLKKIIFDILRISLGVILLYSSLTKAIDPVGAMFNLEHKLSFIGFYDFFKPFIFIWVILTCLLEFIIAISLIFGLLIRYSIIAIVILQSLYLPFLYIVAKQNPFYTVSSCNPLIISNLNNFILNTVLWLVAIIVFLLRKNFYVSKLNERLQLNWILTSGLVLFFFILINYSFLPIFDLTCFPKGTDLNKKIEKYFIDVDRYHKYKIKVLYYNKKTKKFKYFQEENIPWKDSSWIWINTKLIPIKQTFKGEINNFCIVNSLGRDITDSLLNIKEPLVIITSYNLEGVNKRGLRKAIEFARIFRDQYFSIAYLFTNADQKTVDSIIELTGAYDIEFCYLDQIFLKSISRSNPEIIILKRGVILMKRHYNLLPNLKKINFYMY